jgi:hypothetical protein
LTLELGSLLPKVSISKLMESRIVSSQTEKNAWDVEAGKELKGEAGTSSN